MRIDLNAGILFPESQSEKSEQASRSSSPVPTGSGETRFSSVRESVTALSATALNAPELRLDRVEALRKQITSGTYQVSSQQIAASLLDEFRTLG